MLSWLLCWLRWSHGFNLKKATKYAKHCITYTTALTESNDDVLQLMGLIQDNSYFTPLWKLTERYAKAYSEHDNKEAKVDYSLGWVSISSQLIKTCFGNPFDGDKRLLLPLTVNDAFRHQMMGFPILTSNETILFDEQLPFTLEDEAKSC